MTNRILFVDDEPLILEGLRLSFYPMRSAWSMTFVSSGQLALQAMEIEPCDLVVTDLRMPKMNGAELLDEVSRRFPQTVRLVLSGQCDQETIVKSVGPIHQYLSKPCDSEQLTARIQQALALRDLLGNSDLKTVVSQLRTIPSLPDSYQEILAELRSTNASLEKVSRLISGDMGMAVKCLQLVNSAFFGLRNRVANVDWAVKLLGCMVAQPGKTLVNVRLPSIQPNSADSPAMTAAALTARESHRQPRTCRDSGAGPVNSSGDAAGRSGIR